jgi:uncharacterized protein YggU (UPF0235/DUF167 family)
MDKLGIECVVHQVSEYPEANRANAQANAQMVEFFAKHFAAPVE